jgi:hypothetical protein
MIGTMKECIKIQRERERERERERDKKSREDYSKHMIKWSL